MTKTAVLLCALAGLLSTALPANAQRVFVSGSGSDSNPCTYPQPCRTFQQAFNTVAAGGEIDVLDPAGYGPLTVNKSISIQAHGFGGITEATGGASAITITAGGTDAITLNGLLIDGAGRGSDGILIEQGGSIQILNCVIRHFTGPGISYQANTPTNLLIEDTVVSDNSSAGIEIEPSSDSATATLNRVSVNNNTIAAYGVLVSNGAVMIKNSVLSNNAYTGLFAGGGVVWLANSSIFGNGYDGVSGASGVFVNGGTVNSYGNNKINGNSSDLNGSLSTATQQ